MQDHATDRAGRAVNDFFVDTFYGILKIEEQYISSHFPDLSVREAHVICAVSSAEKTGANSSAAVADDLKVTAGTLTTAVKQLVKKGYLVRTREKKDRRYVRLSTTEKGSQACKAHQAFHTEMTQAILAPLNQEQTQVLIQALGALSEYFGQVYGNV